MSKIFTNTLKGAGIGLVVIAIIYLIVEYFRQEKEGGANNIKEFVDDIDKEELKNVAITGVLIGGGTVLAISSIGMLIEFLRNDDESYDTPSHIYPDKYLRELLKEMKTSNSELTEEEFHFEVVANLCAKEFELELHEAPKLHGSRAKKISTSSSDYDLAIIFKEGILIEEMCESTFLRLKPNLKKMGYTVREQRHTTGVFIEKEDGSTFSIDILPARISSNYHFSKDLWMWNSVDGSKKKINIDGHNQQFVGNYEARDTAKLIKQLKSTTGMRLFSPIINKVAIDEIKKKGTQSKFGNLKLVSGALLNELNKKLSLDPFNTNNNYLSKYTESEKSRDKNILETFLEDIANNEQNLKNYFET